MDGDDALYYRYWGKAKPDDVGATPYHLLVYHSLDVAAVAAAWLESCADSVVRRRFAKIAGLDEAIVVAWVKFFVSLHDLGKMDVRFQVKSPEMLTLLFSDLNFSLPNTSIGLKYWHGEYACFWAYEDLDQKLGWKSGTVSLDDFITIVDPDNEGNGHWEAWKPWLQAVAGHHGKEPDSCSSLTPPPFEVQPEIVQYDHQARLAWLHKLDELFLKPVGLSVMDKPPPCDVLFLAGFCSVCDWLGSMTEDQEGKPYFVYQSEEKCLHAYWAECLPVAEDLLQNSGLLGQVITTGGMAAVFPDFVQPRQVQTLVNQIPTGPALTLIEAPTGSGKTEAALAYASHLLAQGKADSIIFALPTQATANAMLERLGKVAGKLFMDSNVILAHGKAGFNPRFISLKKAANQRTPQSNREELEAGVQCARWLSESRKRVFLGQIGVCTVDQVLVSVLPVRHRFVRSFGLGKSVLIIDEVHAYDSYMYGLLECVLKQQKSSGGSAVLLSATLPLGQRQALLKAWDGEANKLLEDNPYPLITHAVSDTGNTLLLELAAEEKQRLSCEAQRMVQIDWTETVDVLPDDALFKAVAVAAENGANVVLICNLVADAQQIYETLQTLTDVSVGLFHSRYRFKDRQRKEQNVLTAYGAGRSRKQGGILVATQVVEQSLDLDFDWMITQLCPMDLLFQRMGRLHRHQRVRPESFEQARCTVLLPENQRYDLHKIIYGHKDAPHSRVLWRTEQYVRDPEYQCLLFPDVYRSLVETVYQEAHWSNEPQSIQDEYQRFQDMVVDTRKMAARFITDVHNVWDDDDQNVAALTRDGEMSLNIVPVLQTPAGRCFLDNQTPIAKLEEWQLAEQIMLNTVPAPDSWKRRGLPDAVDGLIWLVMEKVTDKHWQWESDKAQLNYTAETGLSLEVF